MDLPEVEEIELSVNDIKPYKYNNKIHTEENIANIAKSIREFGYLSKIGVDENNVILYGEGRFHALQSLGYNNIVVQRVTHLDEAKKRAFRILDNKLSDDSVYDKANIERDIAWLLENSYETDLDMLFEGAIASREDILDDVEDALNGVVDNDAFNAILERASGNKFVETGYERQTFEKGDVIKIDNLTIIFDTYEESTDDALYIVDDSDKDPTGSAIIFPRNSIRKYKDVNRDFLVWHKGGVNYVEGEFTLYNSVELIYLRGKEFSKRRFNNLITAIPEKETPNLPPVALFDDLFQNFLKGSEKVVISKLYTAGVAAVNNRLTSKLFCENAIDINDCLSLVKKYNYPKSKMKIIVNGEEKFV